MADSPISPHKPHDQFFKSLFSYKRVVENYTQNTLPKELAERLDFSTLTRDSNSYLNKELKESFADLVYRIKLRDSKEREVWLAFLLEHKSFEVKNPYLQLLEYMLGIWKLAHKDKEKLLPIVIPMIVYQGRANWEYKSFGEYFWGGDLSELKDFIPDFSYLLTNLQVKSDREIEVQYEEMVLQRGFLVMKHIWDDNLVDQLESLLSGLDKIMEEELKREYFRTFKVYLQVSKSEKIMEKVESLAETWGFVEGSAAHKWYTEGQKMGEKMGEKKGEKRGKNIGVELTLQVIQLRKEGKTAEEIAQITKLELEKVKEILEKLGM